MNTEKHGNTTKNPRLSVFIRVQKTYDTSICSIASDDHHRISGRGQDHPAESYFAQQSGPKSRRSGE